MGDAAHFVRSLGLTSRDELFSETLSPTSRIENSWVSSRYLILNAQTSAARAHIGLAGNLLAIWHYRGGYCHASLSERRTVPIQPNGEQNSRPPEHTLTSVAPKAVACRPIRQKGVPTNGPVMPGGIARSELQVRCIIAGMVLTVSLVHINPSLRHSYIGGLEAVVARWPTRLFSKMRPQAALGTNNKGVGNFTNILRSTVCHQSATMGLGACVFVSKRSFSLWNTRALSDVVGLVGIAAALLLLLLLLFRFTF